MKKKEIKNELVSNDRFLRCVNRLLISYSCFTDEYNKDMQ